jgi:hypothetical protein
MAGHESHGGHPAISMAQDSSGGPTLLLKMELVEAIQTGANGFERFCTLLHWLLSLRRSLVRRTGVRTTTTTPNKRKRNAHGNYHAYAREHPEVNGGEHHQHPPPPEEESNDEGVLGAVAAVLNSSHNNLLTMAINQKLPPFVYSLLEARADPCFVDEKRVPALNRACWGRCAIVLNRAAVHHHVGGPWDTSTPRMLLEYGADVNAIDGNGVTPLYIALASYAVEGANTGLWKLLFLEYHADPYILCKPKRLNPSLPSIHETCVDLAMRMAVDDEGIFHREHSSSCLQFLAAVDHRYSTEYLKLAHLQREGHLPPWHSY